jgi:aminopeptidase C
MRTDPDNLMDVPNRVTINNTIIDDTEFVDKTNNKAPLFTPLFEKYGTAPEDVWRNFLHVTRSGPWQTVVNKESLEDKFHFKNKLFSFASQFQYAELVLITKEDICKLVYDLGPESKQETIDLLKKEIAFKEKCKEYVFAKVEYYPDMEHYDLDKYQEIVNTYNEIK